MGGIPLRSFIPNPSKRSNWLFEGGVGRKVDHCRCDPADGLCRDCNRCPSEPGYAGSAQRRIAAPTPGTARLGCWQSPPRRYLHGRNQQPFRIIEILLFAQVVPTCKYVDMTSRNRTLHQYASIRPAVDAYTDAVSPPTLIQSPTPGQNLITSFSVYQVKRVQTVCQLKRNDHHNNDPDHKWGLGYDLC